ncbi:MAG: topology modulation protein [Alphaproteobacteria bacterium]
MNRICVIGCGGAGKSTFSRKLHHLTGTPLIHLDTLFWTEGWIEEDKNIFHNKLNHALSGERWIIDGNFHNTMPQRFAQTDTIIWLDYSTLRCLYGVIKRIMKDHGKTRTDMAKGCREKFDWPFLTYVLRFRTKTRPKIVTILDTHAKHCKILIFRAPNDMNLWLKNYDKQN